MLFNSTVCIYANQDKAALEIDYATMNSKDVFYLWQHPEK